MVEYAIHTTPITATMMAYIKVERLSDLIKNRSVTSSFLYPFPALFLQHKFRSCVDQVCATIKTLMCIYGGSLQIRLNYTRLRVYRSGAWSINHLNFKFITICWCFIMFCGFFRFCTSGRFSRGESEVSDDADMEKCM